MTVGGFERQTGKALRDPAPRLGLMDIWLNLSEWVPLPMNEVSCKDILLLEPILRAS